MPDAPNLSGIYEDDMPRIRQFMEEVSSSFGLENFEGQELTNTFTTGGVPEVLLHKLGRVPKGFIIIDQDKAATIRKTASSAKDITLEADVSATKATIFIL